MTVNIIVVLSVESFLSKAKRRKIKKISNAYEALTNKGENQKYSESSTSSSGASSQYSNFDFKSYYYHGLKEKLSRFHNSPSRTEFERKCGRIIIKEEVLNFKIYLK
jgi:hypothetical protein